MRENAFHRGRIVGLAAYFAQALIVLINARHLENSNFGVGIVAIVFAIVTSVLLVLGYQLSWLGEKGYIRFQITLDKIMMIFICYIAYSSGIMFFLLMFETILLFLYMKPEAYAYQMYSSLLVIGLFTVLGIFGMAPREWLNFENLAGVIILFFSIILCRHLADMYARYNRQVIEQERSLDDMLKVVETKCHDAQAAARSKSNFLSNMSHEIRTPINSVLGMNELILRESDSPSIREYAENIDSSGRMLLALINDILDFSKIESGRMELVIVEYSFSSTINDLVEMMRPKIQDKGLKFFLEIDEKLPSVVRGDDVRLRQILTNILTNAIKYTPSGSVTLRITGRIISGKVFLHFEVEDTGIGISEEDMPRLFEAFRRINETVNRNIEGTGLGMNITNNLLDLMGSRLGVKSKEGEGSNFYFTLKQDIVDPTPIGDFQARLKHSGAEDKKRTSTALYAPKAKVLVVDDTDMNRKVFRQLLKRTGIQVDEASSGMTSINMTHENVYDIIFMDHMMPGMDGIEAFHRIRDDEENLCKDVPIIILTANAISGAREMYLKEGFNDFLSKPIMPSKLEDCIKTLLNPALLEELPEGMDAVSGLMKTENNDNGINVEEMPSVDGIDWNFAKIHFPDKEMLDETLENFYHMINIEAGKLQDFYDRINENGVVAEYRIQVHAMKSSAALVGILPMAGMAKVLENAAASEDKDTIMALSPTFLREWRSYKEKMKPLFANKEENVEAAPFDEGVALAHLDALREAAEILDVDIMDQEIVSIQSIAFPWDAEDSIDTLSGLVAALDVESIIELVDEFKSKIGSL